jgi:hypothetical protein
MQLVARAVHALESAATNTVDAFQPRRSAVYARRGREIIDAAQHLMRLRLVHQLDQDARESPPTTHVPPASHADCILLREVAHGGPRAKFMSASP